METGTIVEYLEQGRLLCGVVLAVKVAGGKRLRLLTENSREVNLPERRVTYAGGRLDPGLSQAELADRLKTVSSHRSELAALIVVKDLWEVLVDEQQWVVLSTLASLCFAAEVSSDHEAAVIRALFQDRLYFKFNHDRFFPHSEQEIKAIAKRREKENRRQRLIQAGVRWLQGAIATKQPEFPESTPEIIDILKDYYVFDKDAPEADLARSILSQAGRVSPDTIFSLMVRLGVWGRHENLDFYRYGIPVDWPPETGATADQLAAELNRVVRDDSRRDLTALTVFTIDGSGTMDFDDALSLTPLDDDTWQVGVHISDVAAWIRPGSFFDEAALDRGSSIYTADCKVPMLPPALSEDLCSLKAGQLRPALSTLMTFSAAGTIVDYQILASLIQVDYHLTYHDVDRQIDQEPSLKYLYDLALMLREKRVQGGALTIAIPDLGIQLNPAQRVNLSIIDRYSRARTLVEEMMIAANWTAARFLNASETPAVYRSQAEPRQRMVKKEDAPGSLFDNWVQRKMLPRALLGTKPERHAGLGLEAYTTVTSPIRKYLDLIVQRQVRAALGLGRPYTAPEIENLLQRLEPILGQVGRLQQSRQRYWVLTYLEARVGQKTEALVLDKFKNDYAVLLPDYLLECRLPKASGTNLKPKDWVELTIQHVSARNNLIALHYG